MNLINKDSLAATLDALNEAFFCAQSLSEFEREQAAQWIVSRQGKVGAYADMFAPTKSDFEGGMRLFTGERLRSRVGTAHILKSLIARLPHNRADWGSSQYGITYMRGSARKSGQ